MFTEPIRTCSLALALATVLGVSRAVAQSGPATGDCANIEQEFNSGLQLRDQNLHTAALDVFQGLSRRCPSARVTAQIALAEAALGRWELAGEHLAQALHDPDPWVSSRREALERALRPIRQHLTELVLEVEVPTAEVFIDGARRTAESLWLAPGSRRVEVRASGYRTWSQTIELRANVAHRARVALESMTSGTTPATNTHEVAPQGATAGATNTTSVTSSTDAPPRRTSPLRYVGIGALGVGLAAATVGVVQWIRTSGQSDSSLEGTDGDGAAWARYVNATNPPGAGGARPLTVDQVCERAATDAATNPDAASAQNICSANDTARAMALGFGIGGAVLSAVGVVLIAVSPSTRRISWHVTPTFTASSGGVMVGGSF